MGISLSRVVSIAIPLCSGTIIGLGQRNEVAAWFPTIKKPSWMPPNWLFGPVWTVLYTMMGIASHRVYEQAGLFSKPMALYVIQLMLNLAWSPLFFTYHALSAALLDITALVGFLGATILEFAKYDVVASRLMLPYLGWTCFATALTYNIWLENS